MEFARMHEKYIDKIIKENEMRKAMEAMNRRRKVTIIQPEELEYITGAN